MLLQNSQGVECRSFAMGCKIVCLNRMFGTALFDGLWGTTLIHLFLLEFPFDSIPFQEIISCYFKCQIPVAHGFHIKAVCVDLAQLPLTTTPTNLSLSNTLIQPAI
jgi:hypothetical protein